MPTDSIARATLKYKSRVLLYIPTRCSERVHATGDDTLRAKLVGLLAARFRSTDDALAMIAVSIVRQPTERLLNYFSIVRRNLSRGPTDVVFRAITLRGV